jgi:DGQHR domain
MEESTWDRLLTSAEEIQKRKKTKSRSEIIQRVNVGEETKWVNLGYRVDAVKSNSRSLYLTKEKPQNEVFEDKVWLCFADLGFECINDNANFKIKYSSKPGIEPQQIDVFVVEKDIAIVIECKSAKTLDKKTQFKDRLLAISGQKEGIIKEIRSHFNNDNLSVGFVFITNNYAISDSDKVCSNDVGITMLTQDDVEYYSSLSKNIGNAAKYHVLADIFEKQKIPSMGVSVPAIRGTHEGMTLYTFLIEPAKLLPISFVAHRAKNSKSTETTYQRMIKKARIDDIRKYVKSKGMFPNSIILNLDSEDLEYCIEYTYSSGIDCGTLILPDTYKSAWVIDGQHRLFSFCGTEEAITSFIPVVAFERLNYEKQSEMFIEINSKQAKVDKNLLLEINSESHWDSDKPEEWTSALITRCILKMSKDPISPLYDRLKLLTENTGGELTIASVTRAISQTGIFGQVVGGHFQYGLLSSTKDDVKVGTLKRGQEILTEYFRIFSTIANVHWNKKGKTEKGYLCTNDGITALIIVLRDILKYVDENPDRISQLSSAEVTERVKPYATVIAEYFRDNDGSDEIIRYKKQLGGHGHQQSALDMEVVINEIYPEFTSAELQKHKENTKKQWEEKTKELFPTVREMIITSTIKILKVNYGDATSGWWKKGVPEKIRIDIGAMRESDDEERDYEYYIGLKAAKEIISSRDWSAFKPVFGLKAHGNKKEDQIKWLTSIENIEKLIEEKGRITKDEFDSLSEIYMILKHNVDYINAQVDENIDE